MEPADQAILASSVNTMARVMPPEAAAIVSDQLTAIERYRRPTPERLELTATLTDPWALREPIDLKKIWRFAPDQEIAPYDCEPAANPSDGKAQ